MSQQSCVICASKTLVVRELNADEAASHYVMPAESEVRHVALVTKITSLWNSKNAVQRKCVNCSFRFCDPLVGGDADFYHLAFARDGGYPADKWDYRRTILALNALGLDGKAIEIGSGPGHFLKKINLLFSTITAYEFDSASLTSLEAIKNVKAVAGDIRVHPPQDLADVLFSFQSLEHMSDPISALNSFKDAVRPGGHIFITVPNGRSVEFLEASGALIDMPPNHLTTWMDSSFHAAAERLGLVIKEIDTEPFSLADYIRTDLLHSFLRRAQQPDSLETKVRATRNRPLMAIVALSFALFRWRVWWTAARKKLGPTLWVHMINPIIHSDSLV